MAAEVPPAPPVSRKKNILAILAFLAAFYTIVPFLLGGGLAGLLPPSTEDFDMALTDAEVTDVSMNRQQYTYQLDGNDYKHYNFNAFDAANPADRTGMSDELGYDPSDLGHYLHRGDRLTKAANSPLLTVRRGTIVTHWILYSATPESKLPPPKKVFMLDGDTVVIP
ncbi:hypothetical protein [Hymenobacter negativus]|uniref:Uncharacterized protein n=1 Tax=Hymenobacter negativus TaxID=2795026 RepID=A0ABS3QG88_9BACT|nr:hypothetical protein [Hymenobacter negativus]MBO2009804.1 hypothetical protein [Hymenobacter negativus]